MPFPGRLDTMRKLTLMPALLLSGLILIQCGKDPSSGKHATAEHTTSDSAAGAGDRPAPPKIKINYSEFIFPENKKDSAMSAFREKYSESQRYTILALNRLDEKNAWRADTLMIPDRFEKDFLVYSPFPAEMPVLKEVKKFVIFSYPIQAYAVYQKGSLIKWGPTSMGKKSAQTKRGLMFTNWKQKLAISTVNRHWKLPYNFNIQNTLGIGWHQYDLPAHPASHSCLRLLMDDAKWMYDFGDQWILDKNGKTLIAKGTPVIVFGDYNWGGRKPWKQLSQNSEATQYTSDQLNKEIQPYLQEILDEQKNRENVLAQQQKPGVAEPVQNEAQ